MSATQPRPVDDGSTLFLLNLRNRRCVETGTPPLGWFGFCCGLGGALLITLVFAFPAALMSALLLPRLHMFWCGVPVNGRISECVEHVGSESNWYAVRFVYGVPTHGVEAQEMSGRLETDAPMSVGSAIELRYLAADPAGVMPESDLHAAELLTMGLLALLLIAGSIAYVCWGIPELRRELRLNHTGKQLPGTLLACTRVNFGRGDLLNVRYTLVSPAGVSLKGESLCFRAAELSDAQLPPAGTPLVVLYLADTNHRAL